MNKRYPGDGGPTWVEDIGGDELTRRTLTHYSPEESDTAFRDRLRESTSGSFRRRVEDVLAQCDEVLAIHEWAKEHNGKRRFPQDRDCEPYSHLWYAGLIGELCSRFLIYDEFSSDEQGLQQAMSIGVRYNEWEWRAKYKLNIVRGAKVKRGDAKGHPKAHGTPEQKAARWGAMAADFRELRAQGTPVMAAYSLVAEKCGVSDKTVQRRVRD